MSARTLRRRLATAAAVACGGAALYAFTASPAAGAAKGPGAPPVAAGAAATPAAAAQLARGRALFLDGCSSCHGNDARGGGRLGPSLYGVGAAAADFYLRTGRMPLAEPHDEPTRAQPQYNPADIAALVAYVASLGPGPPVPTLDLAAGRVNAGMESFTDHCAGCHQVGGAGGIVTGAIAPALNHPNVTPTEIAEAVRVGPYVMPVFTQAQISDPELADIVAYVVSTQHPNDAGGWGIGHVGPIPEGMIAWLLAAAALVLVARLIGERNRA
ncbi:MAG: ubiquinol-cytochrome c reductase cytochrome c subunit [Solirubrobacteraceae bacterium]|nr:ubiquinol-cytochrome c reductase cytochrome c subunit [Solirubrobacteraceae bacterium]